MKEIGCGRDLMLWHDHDTVQSKQLLQHGRVAHISPVLQAVRSPDLDPLDCGIFGRAKGELELLQYAGEPGEGMMVARPLCLCSRAWTSTARSRCCH